jgi:flagellar hook-basal body complex protein FliE
MSTAPITPPATDAFARAAAAYRRAATADAPPAADTGDAGVQPSFAALLKDGVNGFAAQQQAAEQGAAAAVDGKAELASVITAVAEADLTLQAVVAVRDRVIEAYKEIMRMPV